MARIEDLIDDIPDPELRQQIAREIRHLKANKRFGLVYEQHVPETVSLFGLPVRPGFVVQKRTEPDDQTRYEVVSVDRTVAEVRQLGTDGPSEEWPVGDLLTVKRFEEPIYPGLTPIGDIRRGPASKPFHSVVNGENYHALQLLAYTLAGAVDAIYIDPPYNTGARDWKYNNRFVDANDSYRRSKWLTMMEKRLKLAKVLLRPEASLLMITIDDNEIHSLGLLLDDLFPACPRQIVSITISPRGKSRDGRLSQVDEYLVVTYVGEASIEPLPGDGVGSQVRWRYLRREDVESARGTKKGGPKQFYPIYVDSESGRIVELGDALTPKASLDSAPEVPGAVPVFPVREDGKHMNWGLTSASLARALEEGYVRVTPGSHANQAYTIAYLTRPNIRRVQDGTYKIVGQRPDGSKIVVDPEGTARKSTTAWRVAAHDAGSYGTTVLRSFIGDRLFPYPKSLYAVTDTLKMALHDKPDAMVVDFFAGSMSTVHALMVLNQQDGGHRMSVSITNNDVSDAEAKDLNEQGHFVGDSAFESLGIFEWIARPRVAAAVSGLRPDGEQVKGSYLEQYLPDHDYADGFAENVAFFRMDYLEPDLVELGRQYEAIVPLLWMSAGSRGSWEPWDGESPWSAPEDSSYAVLFDEAEAAEFAAHVASRTDEISHAWIVTDSHSAFLDLREHLPDSVIVGRLYRDYLRNFVVNAPGLAQ